MVRRGVQLRRNRGCVCSPEGPQESVEFAVSLWAPRVSASQHACQRRCRLRGRPRYCVEGLRRRCRESPSGSHPAWPSVLDRSVLLAACRGWLRRSIHGGHGCRTKCLRCDIPGRGLSEGVCRSAPRLLNCPRQAGARPSTIASLHRPKSCSASWLRLRRSNGAGRSLRSQRWRRQAHTHAGTHTGGEVWSPAVPTASSSSVERLRWYISRRRLRKREEGR